MFDELDTLTPDERETRLFDGFGARLDEAARTCPGLARHLEGHSLLAVNDRAALQQLPILRKQTLMQAQQQTPPFGDFVNLAALEGQRVFMSPGPVWEPQLPGSDPWQAARALHAAGIRRGDRIHNAFSYHLTPGGFILDEGARALGGIVFPAGVGGTEAQVQAIRQFAAQVYVGTPDYLQTLLDQAVNDNQPLSWSPAVLCFRQCVSAMPSRVFMYSNAMPRQIWASLPMRQPLMDKSIRACWSTRI